MTNKDICAIVLFAYWIAACCFFVALSRQDYNNSRECLCKRIMLAVDAICLMVAAVTLVTL